MPVTGIRSPWSGRIFRVLLAAWLCLLAGCQTDEILPREEKYVTVRLNDSLKRYDSVEILILADGDSAKVVGTVWKGPLANPGAMPSYRLAEGEARDLSVRVRGFDSAGNLALNLVISKRDGEQVVAHLPIPVVKPRDTVKTPEVRQPWLADLAVVPGPLSPAFRIDGKDYRVDLPWKDSTITLQAKAAPEGAHAVLGGDTLSDSAPSRALPLKVGENVFTLKAVLSGNSDTYTVRVWREEPPAPVDTSRKDPYQAWKHRGLVIVNLKPLGMDRAWSEAGFPLLLRLAKANFNFTQASGNGSDVRFSRLDGTPIPYELARWEPGSDRAEIWFRADTLRVIEDSARFYMYWGNANTQSESDGAKVFGTADGHSAVYHLDEPGKGEPGEYKDAGGRHHGRGGSGDGENVPVRVEGVVDYAQDFRPTPGGLPVPQGQLAKLKYPAAIELPRDFDPGNQYWTMQAWVKRIGYTSDASLFQKGDDWLAGNQRFQIVIHKDNSRFAVAREGANVITDIHVPGNQFVHMGVVYHSHRLDIFVDGFLRSSHDWTQGGAPIGKCVLGAAFPDASLENFDGLMDEVWAASVTRSPMWMRLTFENQRQGSLVVGLRR